MMHARIPYLITVLANMFASTRLSFLVNDPRLRTAITGRKIHQTSSLMLLHVEYMYVDQRTVRLWHRIPSGRRTMCVFGIEESPSNKFMVNHLFITFL